MNNYNEVKKSFGTQAEKFASYHMSKAEYTDYLIRSIQAKGNEHALEVAAGTCICGRAVAPYVKVLFGKLNAAVSIRLKRVFQST